MGRAEQFDSVSFDATNPVDTMCYGLLNELKSSARLPHFWPFETREDGIQNVFVYLLNEAKKGSVDLLTLIRGDPVLTTRKLEAERSRIRRERAKMAASLSEEMQQSLPAQYVLSECESSEIVELACQRAGLTFHERSFILHWYVHGIEEYSALSEIMGVKKDELYRLHSEAKNKLRRVPTIVEQLLKDYVDH